MDWVEFATIVASAGIVSSALSGLGSWWQRRRQGRFLALRLAIIFEEYVAKCMSDCYDHRNSESSRGAMGQQATWLPDPPSIPQEDANWPSLEHKAAHDAFRFAGAVKSFNDRLSFQRSIYDDVDADELLSELFMTANRAQALARNLRNLHNVGGLTECDLQIKQILEARAEYSSHLELAQERRQKRSI